MLYSSLSFMPKGEPEHAKKGWWPTTEADDEERCVRGTELHCASWESSANRGQLPMQIPGPQIPRTMNRDCPLLILVLFGFREINHWNENE